MERKTMKVISETDLYVSLKTGDAVRLYAGEAREFPEYIGYACIQAGAKEVREEPKAKTAEVIEEAVIEETTVITKTKPKGKTTKKK
tara:strand:+ start:222 stop:482 length:261 start_codon:yes stop_codon:yes gene_type:complete